MNSLEWFQLPALQNNYVYLIHDRESGSAAVIDPSESDSVYKLISSKGLKLQYIFNTHHHWDHVGGNSDLKEKTGCQIVTSKYDKDRIEGSDATFNPSEMFRFGDNSFSVLDIPGHTLGHVALWFRAQGYLFCGDTLFSLGCGRLFEGTAQQMWASLRKLIELPDETMVFCAHEYTLKNCEFALSLDPDNGELRRLKSQLASKRARGISTVPTLLGDEKRLNPFLRCEDPSFKKLIGFSRDAEAVEVFAHVRRLKDGF